MKTPSLMQLNDNSEMLRAIKANFEKEKIQKK
jgi:hypothetical protein